MPGVYDIGLVFQQLVDALYDIPLAEHDPVPHGHQPVLHVGLQAMHEVYAVREEPVEEPLLDVAPVSEDLSEELLREDLPDAVIPVVHVCACKTECHDLPTVVAQQVEPEAVAPAHRAPAVGGHAPEDLVGIAAKVVAYGYHRAVDEAYPGTSAESHDFHEQHHQEEHARHKFHEAVVGHGRREIRPQVLPYEERVIVLEVREGAEMVADRYCHYLALAHLPLTVPAPLSVCGRKLNHGIFFDLLIKFLAKLVDSTENFCNFVGGNHRRFILYDL